MSYILDALRKSEQRRRHGAAPTLLTAQATAPIPALPRVSMNVWLVAALLGAGILIGWLRPWQGEAEAPMSKPMPKPMAAQPHDPAPPTPAVRLHAPDASGKPPPEREDARREGVAPALAGRGTRAGMGRENAANTANTLSGPASLAAGDPAEAAGENSAMSPLDLPSPLREEIPNITISFHVYSSKPADRRVMINNELLRQGDGFPPGLVVEQITPDGVVIGYKGFRFRRGVR